MPQDHEPIPGITPLVKNAPPTPDVPAAAAPMAGGFPASGFAPGQPMAQAPAIGATPSMGTATVDTFTFEFMREGTPYRAQITANPMTGVAINLQKFSGGTWQKSVSRMRDGILGAFVLNQAIAAAPAATESAAKTEGGSNPPEEAQGDEAASSSPV